MQIHRRSSNARHNEWSNAHVSELLLCVHNEQRHSNENSVETRHGVLELSLCSSCVRGLNNSATCGGILSNIKTLRYHDNKT